MTLSSKKLIVDTASERAIFKSDKQLKWELNGDFAEILESNGGSWYKLAVFFRPVMIKYGEKE